MDSPNESGGTEGIMKYEKIYFTGYAKLPANASASTSYSQFTLGILISIKTGRIEEADCTLLTELARNMVKSYFVGHHIIDEFDDMVEEVMIRHQGAYNKALVKAIGDIKRKYIAFCEANGILVDDTPATK